MNSISQSDPLLLDKKPAFSKGLLWFLFSGTAMFSAFALPVHIFMLTHGFEMEATPVASSYFFILISSALYHGLYRTKTIFFDLGFGKYQKTIGWILTLIFIAGATAAFYIFFMAGIVSK